ncbi:MAG: transcriptional repressor [Proteobacteria bacterium]|nr:transcriptional repressor [Pseudomonadota bacterium]
MKAHGLKLTRQREQILEAFLGAEKHVGVEELLGLVRRLQPGIGHATVYRTMKLFVDSGIATERKFSEGATLYEPEDGGHHHHDHLICTRCGTIVEWENEAIEELQEQVARQHGFVLTDHKMELYGLCSNCQKKA